MQPLTLFPSSSYTSFDERSVGGKASNLWRLAQIPEIEVPNWEVLTTEDFNLFIEESNLKPHIHQLSLENSDEKRKALYERIEQSPVPGAVKEKLVSIVAKLGRENKLAVRSSAVGEDGKESSQAGLYDTVLNVEGYEEIEKAVLHVWASAFNGRREASIDPPPEISVIIQQMVEAEVSGVASSSVLGNNYPGIEISAAPGVGAIVDGEKGDNWIVHPDLYYTLEQTKGISDRTLSPQEVKAIAEIVNKIRAEYKCHVDVEYALDRTRRVFVLQARPLVQQQESSAITVLDSKSLSRFPLIAKGLFSIPGAASGKLVYVKTLDDLRSRRIVLSQENIVVTEITTNVWTQFLNNIAGLITKEGASLSHPMLLCRERKIPCVIGISENFEAVCEHNGQTMTLDGWNRAIYLGSIPQTTATQEDLDSLFTPVKIRPWPDIQSILPNLIEKGLVVEFEGDHWRRTPTFPVIGFQKELNLLRFAKVPHLLGKDKEVAYREIDGYTCSKLVPFEEYVNLFSGITTRNAAQFIDNFETCMKEFLEITSYFQPTKDCWDRYIDAYSNLRAYVWLSGAFQSYATRKIDEIGVEWKLPSYYLDAASEHIQDQLHSLELDVAMRESLREAKGRLPENLPDLFNDADTETQEIVRSLAKKFRFEHLISIERPVDLQIVYTKLKTESSPPSLARKLEERTFLNNIPDLVEWLHLSIKYRILQCNSHHVEARGRIPMHASLSTLGGNEIFTKSIQEIREILNVESV